jgi:hypothetical protein
MVEIKNGRYRDTGSIGYTRHRTKPIQRHWQHGLHKTRDEDNPETLAAWGIQDTGRRQSRDTGSVEYTRLGTKTIQRHWQHFCVPHATSVSGLSSSCVLCTQCCQCLWIAHFWFPPSVFSNVYSNPLFIVDLIHLKKWNEVEFIYKKLICIKFTFIIFIVRTSHPER